MYQRVTWIRVDRARLDEFSRVWKEEIMPPVRACKGNWRELLNQDEDEPDRFVIFSVWHEKALADRFDQAWGFDRVMAQIRPYLVEEPATRIFETAGYQQPLTPLHLKFRAPA